MADSCEDCPEILKTKFQVDSLELCIKKQDVKIEEVRGIQEARDIEHEAMIRGLTSRMDNMANEFDSFKKNIDSKIGEMNSSVNTKIDAMEKSIPTMFENSVNALLAKIAKWLLISVGVLLAVIILAVTRPVLIDALDELHNKIENVEVIE
ncbi:MAG TPA: hypothetical protein DE117_05305 [Fervidobacterium sp.]|nr:hypothetical protein [Fervidobacterium sp.]